MASRVEKPESTEWTGGVKPVLKRDPFPETPEEKINRAEEIKEEGNRFFKDKNYQKARVTYAKAIAFIPITTVYGSPSSVLGIGHIGNRSDDICEEDEDELTLHGRKLRGLLRSNMALTELKLGRYREALQHAEAALAVDPENHKANFRKGQALMYAGDLKKARKIFKDAAQADPKNLELRKVLAEVDIRVKATKLKERKRFQGKLTKDGFC